MKSTLYLVFAATAVFAQMQDNRQPQMSCDNNYGFGNRQARSCTVREQTLPAAGRLSVNPGGNGGATVKGWLRSDVLVRSRIEAWADNDSEASLIASQVQINAGAGLVTASGPSSQDRTNWSVSFEIFVPQNSDLEVKAYNGGVHVSDVRGRLELSTHNGGLHLERVAGDVKGETMNGGVHVELAGNSFDGRQLELSTKNGGVHLAVPQNFSARIQAETVNGSVKSDFPLPAAPQAFGRQRPRNVEMNLGGGGPLIHISTTNGGVSVVKQ